MKLVANGCELDLLTDSDGTPVSIRKAVDRHTDLSKSQTQWNLRGLVNIITNDTLQSDQTRVDAEYKRDIAMNMMLGAITGGVLDGMVGDDSIVNGVLVGTAFGAIATNKRKPVAQVGLVFVDGESVAVEVDKREYNILQTFCIQNLKQIQDNGQSAPSKEYTKYNEQEYATVGSMRKFWSFFTSIILFVGMLLFIFSNFVLFGDGTDGALTSGVSRSDSLLGSKNMMPDIMPVMIVIMILLALCFLGQMIFSSLKKPDDFIKHGENSNR